MNKIQPKSGEHFAVVNLGAFDQLEQFVFEAPKIRVEGKLFLKELLSLTSAEISINKLPPGESVPFYHKHRSNEEIYVFIKGKGEFQVDDVVFGVEEGSIVRVDPNGERCWRNHSTEDLYCLVIQARSGTFTGQTIQDGVGVEKRVSWSGKTYL